MLLYCVLSITDANYYYPLIGYDLSIAVVICFNVCVHLFYLIRSSFMSCKKKYKNKICRRKKKGKKVKKTLKKYEEDYELDVYSSEMDKEMSESESDSECADR